jgi:hypothetical protein
MECGEKDLSFLRYCGRVLHVALSHSLHAAHSIILVLLIVAGLATSLIPSLEIIPDLQGWQVAASVLTAIVSVRLLLARDGILFYLRRGTGFRNCDNVTAA